MSNIEVIVCLVMLFMAVPDVCRKLGRPALAFSMFVVLGFLIGPLAAEGVRSMLQQAGQVGFLLLLFEVGLEIDLPPLRELMRPFKQAATWSLIQMPVVILIGAWVGLHPLECLIAATALTACSVGMAYPAWQSYPGLEAAPKKFVLSVMIAMEMLAIAMLAIEKTSLAGGSNWMIPVKLAGILLVVFLIAQHGTRLTQLFELILQRTTRWRVHFLVLLILAICAVGQRFGLDAAKTAFFLGLFMNRTQHNGMQLEEYMAPVSRQFLIPIFFVALGMQIDWHFFLDSILLISLGTAFLLIGIREIVHRRWLKTGGNARVFLLFCPNLTIVALAAREMLEHGADSRVTAWLVLTGLLMTIPAILMLPAGEAVVEEKNLVAAEEVVVKA